MALKTKSALRIILLATASATVALPALAQDAGTPASEPAPATAAPNGQHIAKLAETDANPNETIVVTALKQATNLKSVPASVTVLSSDQIAAKGITTGYDLNGIAPNLQVAFGQGGNSSPRVRGLGSNSAVFSIEPAVAQYMDGVYSGHPRDLIVPLYDLDSIEVVRGTQSTLLGKNTTLGAMVFTSKRPGNSFGYTLTAEHEFEFGGNRLEGAINIPLSETFKVRVAGFYDRTDGYVYNEIYQDKEPRKTFASGRVSAMWTPSSQFDATLLYQRDHYSEFGQDLTLFRDTPGGAIAAFAKLSGQTNFQVDPNVSYNGSPSGRPYDHQNGDRLTAILNYDLGWGKITSQSAYVDWDAHNTSDLDFTSADILRTSVGEPNKLFSQEVRLATPTSNRINFLGGVYYLWNRWGIDQGINAFQPWPLFGQIDVPYTQTVNAVSGYGNVNFALTDKLHLSGGLRYTHEEKDAHYSRALLRPGTIALVFAPYGETYKSRTEGKVDWSASARYEFDPNNQIYAAAASGSKSGGFQTLASNPALVEYEGERARTYEVGAKLRPLDGLNAEIALYNTKVSGFQFSVNTPLGNSIQNVDVRSRGFDMSFNWHLSQSLQFDGGGGYVDAKILQAFPGAPAGTPMFRAPHWSGNLDLTWRTALTSALDLTVRPSVDAATKQYLQLPSANAPIEKGYVLGNLRVAVSDKDRGWEVATTVRNIGNYRFNEFATSTLLLTGGFYGIRSEPRTVYLSLTIKR